MSNPAHVEHKDDDSENPEDGEAAIAEGTALAAGAMARPKTSPNDPKGKEFSADELFVAESASGKLQQDRTESMSREDAAKNLKGHKGSDIISHAVRSLRGEMRLVVVTARGRKLARRL